MRRRGAWALALAGLVAWSAAAAAAEVAARLAPTTIEVGDAATLTLVVRGALGPVGEAVFTPPPGVEILGRGRSQNFTGAGGHGAVETVFRFELSANAPGRYPIGPVAVQVGKETFRSALLTLQATAAERRIAGTSRSSGPASLVVDLLPEAPLAGQPCVLRVRLVLRATLAEDPQYTPPVTPGLWTDKTGTPQSYYADEHGERVLVTETRTRVYPLSVGEVTVGSAEARLELTGSGRDAQAWSGDRVPRREVALHSAPLKVRVAALPPGAPAGFAGAVGGLSVRWTADRARTSLDVPVVLRLDVRGVGNLPLVRAPELRGSAIEVFANAVEDSLPAPGSDGPGRRRFQWTVLPRRLGRLSLAAPAFAWFDPASHAYARAEVPPVGLEVGPPLYPGADDGVGWPATFARHPVDPGARAAAPWAWGLAGLMVGGAIVLWRGGSPAGAAAGRGRSLEWLRAVGRARGPDFWRAADEAAAWLAERGGGLEGLRGRIATARFAGQAADEESVRRQLIERIAAALPPKPARTARRAGAVGLVAAAILACVLLGPRPGDERARAAVAAGDRAARGGDPDQARSQWGAVWREGGHHPGLAARLAWTEMQSGSPGAAAAWVVRGERAGARDPALGWIAGRVREGGGLTGDATPRWPVRPLEWAIAALLLGALAGALWPRRVPAVAAALLSVAAGLAGPFQQRLDAAIDRGVVQEPVTLAGAGLDLQPGQVVRVLEQRAGRARVDAGGGAAGWVADSAIDIVRSTP